MKTVYRLCPASLFLIKFMKSAVFYIILSYLFLNLKFFLYKKIIYCIYCIPKQELNPEILLLYIFITIISYFFKSKSFKFFLKHIYINFFNLDIFSSNVIFPKLSANNILSSLIKNLFFKKYEFEIQLGLSVNISLLYIIVVLSDTINSA